MISKHGKLLARTVLVRNNEVEKSFNLLNRKATIADGKSIRLLHNTQDNGLLLKMKLPVKVICDPAFLKNKHLVKCAVKMLESGSISGFSIADIRVLQNEKILKEAKMHEYFERPCDRRNRICFERCKRIYDVEMSRKMRMLMRKNRVDPFPR